MVAVLEDMTDDLSAGRLPSTGALAAAATLFLVVNHLSQRLRCDPPLSDRQTLTRHRSARIVGWR